MVCFTFPYLLAVHQIKRLCAEDVLEDTFWSPWPWPRGLKSSKALFFELLKFCGALKKVFGKRNFVEIGWKIFVKTFFFFEIAWIIFVKTFFFWRALALVSLVLGLEHSCPWPRECLSSERLSLASDFFCVIGLGLGLEPCVLDCTSGSVTHWVINIAHMWTESCGLCKHYIKRNTCWDTYSYLTNKRYLKVAWDKFGED